MLRIEIDRYGGPEVLRAVERPAPEPRAGEVEIRPSLIGVNRADLFIRSGHWPQAGGFPYVPGLESAGVIERVGPGVTGLVPGDRVITMMQRLGGIHGERPGGYQQRVLASAPAVARIPDGLDLELAAVLGLPAVTAFLSIEALAIETDQRVLVLGASSAVGMMAVQMLAARGAIVIGTVRSEAKRRVVRESGASAVVSTSDPGWAESVGPVDRVFDLVGQATFRQSVDLLSAGGRLVFVGGTSGGDLELSGWALMRPVTLTGYSSETLDAAELERAMQALASLAGEGRLRAALVRRYPLAEAARAHADIESGSVAGRVLLQP